MSNREKRVTDTGTAVRPAPGSPAAELASKPGLRIRPYRPMRAFAGAFLVVASVVAALAIYARLDDRIEVLVLTRDVLAGEQITDADLKVDSLASDTNVMHVLDSERHTIMGMFARVAMAAGDLVTVNDIQERPLTRDGYGLVSVPIPFAHVPTELREQSHVWLVVTPPTRGGEPAPPVMVDAIVVSMPHNPGDVIGEANATQGMVAITVEVSQEYAAVIGQAAAISMMLVKTDAGEIPAQVQAGEPPTDTAAAPDGAVVDATTTLPTGSAPAASAPEGQG